MDAQVIEGVEMRVTRRRARRTEGSAWRRLTCVGLLGLLLVPAAGQPAAGTDSPFSRDDLINGARESAIARFGPEAADWRAFPGPDGSVQVRSIGGDQVVVAKPGTNSRGEPVILTETYWRDGRLWNFRRLVRGMWIGGRNNFNTPPAPIGGPLEPVSATPAVSAGTDPAPAAGPFSRNDLINAARESAIGRFGPDAADWRAFPGGDGSVQVRSDSGEQVVIARPTTNSRDEPVIRTETYWKDGRLWNNRRLAAGVWLESSSSFNTPPAPIGGPFEPVSATPAVSAGTDPAPAAGPFSRNDLINAARESAIGRFGPDAADWRAFPGADGSVQVRSDSGDQVVIASPSTNRRSKPVIRTETYWRDGRLWNNRRLSPNGVWLESSSNFNTPPAPVGGAFDPVSAAPAASLGAATAGAEFVLQGPGVVTGGWGLGLPTPMLSPADLALFDVLNPQPFLQVKWPEPVLNASAPPPGHNARIESFVNDRLQQELGQADPALLASVQNGYAQRKNANEDAGVTFVRALTAADPTWVTRFPKLLSTLLSYPNARRYILATLGSTLPEDVLRSSPFILIEHIRRVTEATDDSLWSLVDVWWTGNWSTTVPDSVTVLRGLDRWARDWMQRFPDLVPVFLADPDTAPIIAGRLDDMRWQAHTQYLSSLKVRLQQNAYAIEGADRYDWEVVYGALLVQQQYISDLQRFRNFLVQVRNGNAGPGMGALRSAASDLQDARRRMVSAYNVATNVFDRTGRRYTTVGARQQEYEDLMVWGKTDEAAATPWGGYVEARQAYIKLLEANPLLGLKHGLLETFFFDALMNTQFANDQERRDLLNAYLDSNIRSLTEEIDRASQVSDIDGLRVFLTGKHFVQQNKVRLSMNALGASQAAAWVSAGVGAVAVEDTDFEDIVFDVVVEGGLALVAGFGWYIPVIGPGLAIGANLMLITKAGTELTITYLDAESAEEYAGVTGFRYYFTAEDKKAAAQGKFVFTAVGAAADLFIGVQSIRVVNKVDDVGAAGRLSGLADDAGQGVMPGLRVGDVADEFRIAGVSDEANDLAQAAMREGVPLDEAQAITTRIMGDARYVDAAGELTPQGFAQLHNELTIAAVNANDFTIVVQGGTGGRLPGQAIMSDLDELVVFAGSMRPTSGVLVTDLSLWQQIRAKMATRPKPPAPDATPAQIQTYQRELQAWENGWTQEMINAVENGILTRSDDTLLKMREWNPYEATGVKEWQPGTIGGFEPIFSLDDLTDIRNLWAAGPPRPAVPFNPSPNGPVPLGGPFPRPGFDAADTVAGRLPGAAADPSATLPFGRVFPIPGRLGTGARGLREGLVTTGVADDVVGAVKAGRLANGNPVGAAFSSAGEFTDFLRANNLMPSRALQIGDQTFYFSRPFLGELDYLSYLMFTRAEDGSMAVRLIVESRSGGSFRNVPFMESLGGAWGKGPLGLTPLAPSGMGYAFEEGVAVAVEMQPYLFRWAGEVPVTGVADSQRLVGAVVEDISGQAREARTLLRDPANANRLVHMGEFGGVAGRAKPFDPATAVPDLSNPLAVWRYPDSNQFFAGATGAIVPSRDGRVYYMMIREAGDGGRLLFPVVHDASEAITSFGVRAGTPHAPKLTAPGFEYVWQLTPAQQQLAAAQGWSTIGPYVRIMDHNTLWSNFARTNWGQIDAAMTRNAFQIPDAAAIGGQGAARGAGNLSDTLFDPLAPRAGLADTWHDPLASGPALVDTWFDWQAPGNVAFRAGASPNVLPMTTSLTPWYDVVSLQGLRMPVFVGLGQQFNWSSNPPPLMQRGHVRMQGVQPVLDADGRLTLQPAPNQQVMLLPFDFESTVFPGSGEVPYDGSWEYPKGITDAAGVYVFENLPLWWIDTVPGDRQPAPLYNFGGTPFSTSSPFPPLSGPVIHGGVDGGWQGVFGTGALQGVIVGGEGLDPTQAILGGLGRWRDDTFRIGNTNFQTYLYPAALQGRFEAALDRLPGNLFWEDDGCFDAAQGAPRDAYFHSSGSWGQSHDDQWALKAVGLDGRADSDWPNVPNGRSTVVAVIDTGLDWHHPDIDPQNIWRNEDEIPGNGQDDDGNGYVDDIIGWDFIERDNKPWDYDGHGTVVAGIIAAAHNGEGIAGIDPNVKIMVLKGINNLKQSRASYIAKAIVYAVDNGARVINLSLTGQSMTRTLAMAIEYAHRNGVVLVAAAGNDGAAVKKYAPAVYPGVLTVAATGPDGARAPFSNWGPEVDLAAPGVDVLSLRARGTDLLNAMPGIDYQPRENYVGPMRRYYRVSGTSFAAPIVTAAASLLLSKNPDLTAQDVERILKQSAQDIDVPGSDQYTGYGLLDVKAALSADSRFFVEALISGVRVVRRDGQVLVQVLGTADADRFDEAWIELGEGEKPEAWTRVSRTIDAPVNGGELDALPATHFRGASVWMLRLIAQHENGRKREARFALRTK